MKQTETSHNEPARMEREAGGDEPLERGSGEQPRSWRKYIEEAEAAEKKAEREQAGKKQGKKPVERFQNGVLSGIDLSKSLTREEYKKELASLQKRLESGVNTSSASTSPPSWSRPNSTFVSAMIMPRS